VGGLIFGVDPGRKGASAIIEPLPEYRFRVIDSVCISPQKGVKNEKGQQEAVEDLLEILKSYNLSDIKYISIERPFGAGNQFTYYLQSYGVGLFCGKIHQLMGVYPEIIDPSTIKSMVKPKNKKGQRYPKENVEIWFNQFVEKPKSLPKGDKKREALRDAVAIAACGFFRLSDLELKKFEYSI
jgi:Holliday junction resolvasome RuvABC endonuclease subunit